MSVAAIRKAIENYVRSVDAPLFPTAWENVNFAPTAGVAYQAVDLLFAAPDDLGMAGGPYLQEGYLQITLQYPTNQGPGAAQARADKLRDKFKRGVTLPTPNFNIVFEKTPEISGGAVEDGRYVIRVRCRFFAQIDAQ
jgi:hypothetical protein